MTYITETTETNSKLVSNIIRQYPIREELDTEDVVAIVLAIFSQIEMEAKKTMEGLKGVDLFSFEKLIEKSEVYLNIIEYGFREKINMASSVTIRGSHIWINEYRLNSARNYQSVLNR